MKVKYLKRMIVCGRKGCKTCPHGPYWYAYYWENGMRRSKYMGRTHKKDARAKAKMTERNPHDDILTKGKQTIRLARRLLWLDAHFSKEEFEKAVAARLEFYDGKHREDIQNRRRVRAAAKFIKDGSLWDWW